MAIVAVLEIDDGGTDFRDVSEDAAVDGLLLQGSVEAFGEAVGLWFGNKGETRGDAPEPDLVEEVIRRVLRPVIHAQRQAAAVSAPPHRTTAGPPARPGGSASPQRGFRGCRAIRRHAGRQWSRH